MRAVVYLRVSTDEQSASGAGLNAQLDACRAHAGRAGLVPAGPFADEGVSGAAGLDRRPALLEAIASMEPGDVLLVAKRDRLGRDPMAIAMIEAAVQRKRGRIVSAAGEGTDGDDPTSILMRRMVDAFAEYERLVIKARTRAALGAKKRRGERIGEIPYGSDLSTDGKSLADNPREREAVALIGELKAAGHSLRAIAGELDRRGIPPKKGGPTWSHAAVDKILKTCRSPQEAGPCPRPPSIDGSVATPLAGADR